MAIGSAVASGCIPCLENITGIARAEGIAEKKLKAAAIIGQFVKDQPASQMKTKADQLLGTHLQSAPVQAGCPMESPREVSTEAIKSEQSKDRCSCS